ncbi:ATP-binding protein [Synechocystis salina]|uniref:histidine kinase n=1 Tax=Synechocystis salina LEGE 00031 TaxID=1828736 RepID=A0ABR9VUI2_9SYNC|nr:ATP-binding protein [Synechocystis salina]MBE9241750.1 CHASE3 domain-containing protein [Synechocystis salina LEGE 00041]MBE9255007.1 CHASE3 domain-containing protein [Synechocystis salina LEGE 00031]
MHEQTDAYEEKRLEILKSCRLLDSIPDYAFDRIVLTLKEVCQVPIALFGLMDQHREWFKAKIGCDLTEAPRETSYCNVALKRQQILIIPDTLQDPVFKDQPRYLKEQLVRFYAGVPLITPDGYGLGVLCIIDFIPRELTPGQLLTMTELARQVVIEIQKRRVIESISRQTQERISHQRKDRFFLKLGIGFGLVIVLRFISVLPSLWTNSRFQTLSQWVIHTQEVLTKINELKLSLQGAQLAVRNYTILNNRATNLSYYSAHLKNIYRHLDQLDALTQDNPNQRPDVKQLRLLLIHDNEILNQLIHGIDRQDFNTVQKIYSSQEALSVVSDLLQTLERIEGRELVLLDQRQQAFRTSEKLNPVIIWTNFSITLLILIVILVWIYHEIRLRYHGESQANRQEEFLEVTLASIGDAVMMTDANETITLMNPVAEVLTDWPHQEAVGQKFSTVLNLINTETQAFYPSPVVAAISSQVNQFLHDGVSLVRRNGETIDVDDSCAPIIGANGLVAGCVMVFRDISEQRRQEEQMTQTLQREQEINSLKNSFISMVSHEFRTPLTSIFSSTELLASFDGQAHPERQDKHLQRIYTSIRRLEQMLDDVLLIGRVESGKLQFQPELMNLELVIEDIVEAIQSGIGRHHQIKANFDNVVEPVFMDAKLIKFIFTNLLSNAVKYSLPMHPVELSVGIVNTGIEIQVIDHGIGIPAEDLPKLFRTFQRASNVGNIHGTGLGLSIVKTCVDLHGGSIEVESVLDQGTRFKVWLPNHSTTLPKVGSPELINTAN